MTMIIKSIDNGEIETGFWGPDTAKVQLGELPLMSTQQFVGYAALTLAEEVIPKLDPVTKNEWAQAAEHLRDSVAELPLRNTTGKYFMQSPDDLLPQLDTAPAEDQAELYESLAAAVVPTDEAVYYEKNPFHVQADGQRVGFLHEGEIRHIVSADDFYTLTYQVIHGGLMGWGDHGTYPEVKDGAVLLNSVFQD
ncbi:MAG TPA: hypothetical protein VK983_02710 [Candidatus Limnocylindrales bacterium]|nr:hypothetical protein [Candidatus Limnocylindrales bacterium]